MEIDFEKIYEMQFKEMDIRECCLEIAVRIKELTDIGGDVEEYKKFAREEMEKSFALMGMIKDKDGRPIKFKRYTVLDKTLEI